MIGKVKATIGRCGMLKDGERVLAALSGGADSTALLLCLKDLGYDVFAVHVNHNLRGEEGLRDQRFCEELCKSKGIELYVESVDVKAYCAENRCSIELGARKLRYAALEKHACGCKIATAHTLSDSLETAIFNLTRGCGVKGLASIPPTRGNIIRPLINCTRSEIEEYLRCKGQGFVTDSTNFESDCSRNIIRLSVIPELKKINPGLEKSFGASVEALREEDALIEAEAKKLLEKFDGKAYDFTGVSDGAALSRAVSKIISACGAEPSYERITSVKELVFSGGRINIKKGVYLRSEEGRLSIEYDSESENLNVSVTLRENADLGAKKLIVTKISPFDISCFNKDELRFIVDESRLASVFTARHCVGGEKIRLPGRGFGSTVKKLLAGLTRLERRSRIVIADSEGAVFVEGIGVSERVCCGSDTVSALKIEIAT